MDIERLRRRTDLLDVGQGALRCLRDAMFAGVGRLPAADIAVSHQPWRSVEYPHEAVRSPASVTHFGLERRNRRVTCALVVVNLSNRVDQHVSLEVRTPERRLLLALTLTLEEDRPINDRPWRLALSNAFTDGILVDGQLVPTPEGLLGPTWFSERIPRYYQHADTLPMALKRRVLDEREEGNPWCTLSESEALLAARVATHAFVEISAH